LTHETEREIPMPTPKKYRIVEASVTVQWRDYWETPDYGPAKQDHFPGIQVPASLAAVAASLQGQEFLIDLDNGKWAELRKQVELHFDYRTLGKGPSTGGDWDLEGTGLTTTSGHIRWVPGATANGLAYSVGKKVGGPSHVEEYPFVANDPNRVGRAGFWLFFLLEEVP